MLRRRWNLRAQVGTIRGGDRRRPRAVRPGEFGAIRSGGDGFGNVPLGDRAPQPGPGLSPERASRGIVGLARAASPGFEPSMSANPPEAYLLRGGKVHTRAESAATGGSLLLS